MITLASIPSPPINDFHIGPIRVTFYGILIAVGVGLGWALTARRFSERGGDRAVVDRILLWMVVIGFVGARIAYVSTHLSRFQSEWWKVIAIWEGGIALFGGLTAGAVTVVVLCRRWSVRLPDFLDSLAPGIPLAQAVGRWGNYFNQELFGTPSDLPWAVEIAPSHRPPEYIQYETFHPTFLYESLLNLALFASILWLDRHVPMLRGRLIGVYLAGYGLMRFLLELIRTDESFRLLGLSRNGWVALGAIIVGLVIIRWPRREAEEPVSVGPDSA